MLLKVGSSESKFNSEQNDIFFCQIGQAVTKLQHFKKYNFFVFAQPWHTEILAQFLFELS